MSPRCCSLPSSCDGSAATAGAWIAAIALGVPLVAFLIFEKWFLLPLPKGPIEEFLGF